MTNIRIIGFPEGQEQEKEAETLFKEIKAQNFPNVGKDLDTQVHEANSSSHYLKAKRLSPRHIIVKLSKIKDKERILKAVREKTIITYKGAPLG